MLPLARCFKLVAQGADLFISEHVGFVTIVDVKLQLLHRGTAQKLVRTKTSGSKSSIHLVATKQGGMQHMPACMVRPGGGRGVKYCT